MFQILFMLSEKTLIAVTTIVVVGVVASLYVVFSSNLSLRQDLTTTTTTVPYTNLNLPQNLTSTLNFTTCHSYNDCAAFINSNAPPTVIDYLKHNPDALKCEANGNCYLIIPKTQ